MKKGFQRPEGQMFRAQRVDKPWGHEILWAMTDRYVGKVLHVRKGESLSLQYHERKDETISVLSGAILLQHGPSKESLVESVMGPGDCFHVTPFTLHRMTAREDSDLLEASSTELDDVVRLEDRYGRQGTTEP
jgi:mannose-6-phosphate isomerase-like protein (cupin superfamily)